MNSLSALRVYVLVGIVIAAGGALLMFSHSSRSSAGIIGMVLGVAVIILASRASALRRHRPATRY